MTIKKLVGTIFPVIDSTKRRQYTADSVIATPQENKGVCIVHVAKSKNVGDYYCGPHLYFDELKDTHLNISNSRAVSKNTRDAWVTKISKNSLIIGGGGLFNIRHFSKQLELFEELAGKGKKIVVWGAGHNATDKKLWGTQMQYNIDVSKFGLVGTRDFSMNNEYVPCVSCLHPIFDRKIDIKHEVGIIFNHTAIKDKHLVAKFSKYETSSNISSLEAMVEMIGSCETVVSNSYHAIYWAMLMGRKTVALPTTSKFFDFKYQPILSSFKNFENDLSKAIAFPGLLDEFRSINNDFYIKAVNYLDL